MNDRIPLAQHTKTTLDALYEQRDEARQHAAAVALKLAAAEQRAEQAEAAIARVRWLVTEAASTTTAGMSDYDNGCHHMAVDVLDALAEPTPAPAAPASILDPDYLRQQYANAVQPLLMDTLPKPIAAARAREIADTITRVRDQHLQQLRQRLELADQTHGEELDAAAETIANRTVEINQLTEERDRLRRRADNAETRLQLARDTLAKDGYFDWHEIGLDIAPRLVEWLAHHRDRTETAEQQRDQYATLLTVILDTDADLLPAYRVTQIRAYLDSKQQPGPG